MNRFLLSPASKFIGKSLYSTVNAPKKLILYSSDDCSLCIHFKKHLDAFLARESEKLNGEVVVETKDIKLCPQDTLERFKHDIPVLTAGDDVICKHRFSTILFRRHLGLEE